jgi:antitoxin FitA
VTAPAAATVAPVTAPQAPKRRPGRTNIQGGPLLERPHLAAGGARDGRRDGDLADECVLANWRFWRHNGAMPSVQIKDVPEETHAVLRRRAAAAHQSLQEYLRARLIAEASEPTLDEVLDRAGGRSGGAVPLKSAVAALRADRDRR